MLSEVVGDDSVSPPVCYRPERGARGFDVEGFIRRHLSVKRVDASNSSTKYVLNHCPFNPEHKAPDAAVFVRNDGVIGFKCFHNSCSDRHWRDVRLIYEPDAYAKTTPQRGSNGRQGTAWPPGTRVRAGDKDNIGTVISDGGDSVVVRFISPEGNQGTITLPKSQLSNLDHPEELIVTRPIWAGDLINTYPTLRDPVIDGLVRRSEIANIISESKVGKSWLMAGTALCVVGGDHLFGKFPTMAGNCLYLDNELHPETLRDRIAAVSKAMGLSREAYGQKIAFECFRGRRVDVFSLDKYLQQFKPGEFTYLVLDALYRFWPKGMSENDNAVWVDIYNQLEIYAERLGIAILIVHHSSKGDQSQKRVTDIGAGGGAQSRAADCHLVLRAHEQAGVAVVDAAVRSFKPVESYCIRFDWPLWSPAPDCDPAKLKSAKRVAKNSATAPVDTRLDRMKQGVLSMLGKAPSTKNALRTVLKASGVAVGEAIKALLEDGEIQGCQVSTPGGIFPGFERVG